MGLSGGHGSAKYEVGLSVNLTGPTACAASGDVAVATSTKEVTVPTEDISVAVWAMKPRRENGDSVSWLLSLVVLAADAILVAEVVGTDNWGETEKA